MRYILALTVTLAFLLSCKKDKEADTPLPPSTGSLDSVGLIKGYKLWDPPADAIHIDPTNTNDALEDGTIEHPFDSFDDVDFENNTVYALKRGTTINSEQIVIWADDVTLASYGDGERPVINCTEVSTDNEFFHAIISDWEGIKNVTIRDLEVIAANASSCIRFKSNCDNMKVINCKLHDSYYGLRSLDNTNLYVYNTEVYNIKDDGMYIDNTFHIEIAHCYVHHVNTLWQPPSTPQEIASGDGIQLNNCNNWHVHNNYVDRTNSGNKFCFISNNPDQNDGILEFNFFTGPIENGSAIYFHEGDNIIIRYNYIKGPTGSPIYSLATGNIIYGNIFDQTEEALVISEDAKVYNNVFYHMGECMYGTTIEAHNNIFDYEEGAYFANVENLTGSNNLFVNGEPTEGSFSGEPMFEDPENGDFHIMKGSDCIDKGINVGLDRDIDGNKIPQGSAPDIGAYEFVE